MKNNGSPEAASLRNVSKQEAISLKYLIVLIIIGSILPILCGYFFYSYEKDAITKIKHDEIKAISDMKVGQIVQWHKERIADAEVTSQASFFVDGIAHWLENKNNKALKNDIINRLRPVKSHYIYEDIFLLSLNGELQFSTSQVEDKFDTVTSLKIAGSATSGKIVFTDFYYCPVHRKIHYDIIAPVIDRNSKAIAVLLFRIDPNEYLYPLIQSWPLPGKTSETLIVRKDGDSILFLNELRLLKNTALKLRIPMSDVNVPAVQAVLGLTGTFEGDDYRGIKVLAYLEPIPATPWFMVAKIDQSEIYSDLHFLTFFIGIFTFVLIVLVCTGLILAYKMRQTIIYRRLLAREKELRANQEEYKTTLYCIGDAVITTDVNGAVRQVNHVAEQLTGWLETEIMGEQIEKIFKIINEESGDKVDNPVTIVLQNGTVVGLANHTMLISKDGREIPIADSGAPIKNESGEITGVVLVFRDQTEERRKMNELQKTSSELKLIFKNMLNAFISWESVFDENGKYVSFRFGFFNDAYARISGVLQEEVLGKDVFEVWPGTEQSWVGVYGSVAVTGIPKTFDMFHSPTKGFYHCNAYRPSESKMQVCVMFEDITESKQAEKALQQSEEMFRAIFQNNAAAIAMIEPDTTISMVNEAYCRLSGYTAQEVIGMSWTLQIPPDDLERLKEYNSRRLTNPDDGPDKYEFKFYRKDGEIRYGLMSVSTIQNPQKIITSFIDITERKLAEEALHTSEAKYRKLHENMMDGFVFVNMEGLICEYNESFQQMLGRSGFDELKKLSYNDITPEKWHEYEKKIVNNQVLIQGYSNIYEKEYRKKDGSVFPVELRTILIKNESGENEGMWAIVRDITIRKQAEIELTKAKETAEKGQLYLNNIINNMGDPVFVKDDQSRLLLVNDAFCEIFELSRNNIIGKTLAEDLTPEGRESFLKIDKQVLTDGLDNISEESLTVRGGQIRTISTRKTRFTDSNDKKFLIGTIRDLTKRIQIEKTLKDSEQKYQSLFNEMIEGFAVHEIICNEVGIPLDYRFLMINPSFEKLTGLSAEATVGKTVLEVIPGIEPFWIETYGKVALMGESVVFENYSKELDRYFRVIAFSHQKGQFATLFEDITERRRVEKALIEANENLEKRVLERTAELLLMKKLLDETGSTARIGGWELVLKTMKQTWTKSVYEIHELGFDFDPNLDNGIRFYAPEALPVISEAIDKCIRYGEPWDLELPLITAKGNRILVRAIGKAIRENDEITRIGGLLQDITQAKKAEEELRKVNDSLKAANSELEAFSYSVSHDLRAPLRHIAGYIDLLTSNFPDSLPEKGRHYLQTIVNSVSQMGILIDDLLHFSRTGRQEMRLSTIDMNSLVLSVITSVDQENKERNIQWITATFPNVFGDFNLLRLVLINLLNNAVKFTRKKDKARIEIGFHEENKELVFYVHDNGVGFDMHYAHKLFGVFQRLHSAAEYEGTGIGLANVQRIILKHGGRVWAESEQDNGATFYFTLPKEEEIKQ